MPLIGQNSYREMDFYPFSGDGIAIARNGRRVLYLKFLPAKDFCSEKNSLYLSGNLNRYIE